MKNTPYSLLHVPTLALISSSLLMACGATETMQASPALPTRATTADSGVKESAKTQISVDDAEGSSINHASFPSPDAHTIQRVVNGRSTDMRQCYMIGTFRNAELAGTVNVVFTIETSGKVSAANDAGSNMPDKEVVNCVLGVFAALEFRPGGIAATEVVYPVSFGKAG